MQAFSPRRSLTIEETLPLGEVALVPSATGRPEPASAQSIASALRNVAPESAAEALRQLRQEFPQVPLSVRVAALAYVMRR
jgi:hypothetical protein